MSVRAIIVAAGEGKRMGKDVSKAFLPLSGRPVLFHTLSRFAQSKFIQGVVLVAQTRELARCEEIIRSIPEIQRLDVILESGGPRRQDSVSRGLARVHDDCEIVVIHDGVRPLVSPGLIDRCVETAFQEGAAIVGLPARETIKTVTQGRFVSQTVARDSLWQVQTPQAFRLAIIREAYDQATRERIEATDDAMLVERLGKAVAVLEGESSNIKITVPEDLICAEALLQESRDRA